MLNEKRKIESLTHLGIELNEIHDLDILMEKILYKARSFSNADAGSIYIKENDRLRFSYTQNATLEKRLNPGDMLPYSIFEIPIDKTSMAGYVAKTGRFLNVPDAYLLSGDLPYSFNCKFDDKVNYRTKSILTLPLVTSKSGVTGVLQVINAMGRHGDITAFTEEDEQVMFHFASIAAVALGRARMTREMLLRMIRMAQFRDPKETGSHVNRVAGYSVEIYEKWAKKHHVDDKEFQKKRDMLRMAAMLHDVGKVAISDLILKKPGRFNDEEFEIMKQHTIIGAKLFGSSISELETMSAEVALNHHEKWDGQGYPGHIEMDFSTDTIAMGPGKKGEEIPLFGRIVALADVYDALLSQRVYKDAWKEWDVIELIKKDAGRHFDPEIVEIFLENLHNIKTIRERYPDD